MAMTPQDFGVVGDGTTDDTTDFQEWLDYCGTNDIDPIVGDNLICKITDTLTFPGATNIDVSRVTFNFNPGTRNKPALVVPASPVTESKTLRFGKISATTIDWGNDDFVGLRLNDLLSCNVHIDLIERFTRGYECISTSAGFAYNSIFPGFLCDNKYNEVLRTAGNGSTDFVNENTFYSGSYSDSSNALGLGDAYGTLLTWNGASSYRGHNNNRWIAPSYELSPASTTYRVPMRFNGVGSFNSVVGARHESCVGPFAILDADNVSNRASHNRFDITFNLNGGAQINGILEVNGANSNICLVEGGEQHRWSSGPLERLLSTAGASSSAPAYLSGDVFFMDTSPGTPSRTLATPADVATMRDGIQLDSAGIFTAVDTTRIKTFKVTQLARSGFAGRICVCAIAADGSRLTGDATDSPWDDEPYVKSGYPDIASTGNYGGSYLTGADNVATEFWFTVRGEVKKIYVGFISGTYMLALQSFEIIGYSTDMDGRTGANAKGAMRVFADLDDDGQKIAVYKPDTSGTHGYYARGQIIGNGIAAATLTAGWQCSAAGWLAAGWAASTAYPILGRIVTNDSGKMYELITAGTSASSGGPTGTSSNITDGSCHWKYIGVKAAFVTLGVTS